MIFGKKSKNIEKCESCGHGLQSNFQFCPRCGNSLTDPKKDKENYGLLGKDDFSEIEPMISSGLGITDKMINSIFKSMMKSMNQQFKNQLDNSEDDADGPEIRTFPNGISIKISGPLPLKNKPQPRKVIKQTIDENQIRKINTLPKSKAKTTVKRLGDKIVYELSIPGISSPKDIFVSKLESGYEIKAIGSKKVYVNSVPINLPLSRYTISKDKLAVEFKANN